MTDLTVLARALNEYLVGPNGPGVNRSSAPRPPITLHAWITAYHVKFRSHAQIVWSADPRVADWPLMDWKYPVGISLACVPPLLPPLTTITQ